MKLLSKDEIEQVRGATGAPQISGYAGANAIVTVVGFASLFTPIGPVTAGIAIGAAGGLTAAQAIVDYC